MKARLTVPDKYAGMTQTEKSWALLLEADLRSTRSSVVLWRYEPVTFRIAPRTTYTPDFWVLYSDGSLECQEIKPYTQKKGGSNWKTSIVKFKTCAKLFPEFRWAVCEKQRDGSWRKTIAADLFKRNLGTQGNEQAT